MLDLTVGLPGVGGRETGPSGTSVWETESITWALLTTRKSSVVECGCGLLEAADPGMKIGEPRKQGRQVTESKAPRLGSARQTKIDPCQRRRATGSVRRRRLRDFAWHEER